MTSTAAPIVVRADNPDASVARRPAIPWSVVALAVPAVVGAVRLIVAIRRPYDFWGDHAIFETAIRRVAEGTQAVGPYSRFGFHQPGPAYFDAQAPFYWLTGASPRALFLGALCLNLGSALGCVLVVRRFFSEGLARWAAVVIGAYLLALTPALMADPWPVYVLGLPLLLTMFLAAAATRSIAAAGGAVVGGSYLVQTHLATSAVVMAILAASGAVTLAARATQRRSSDQAPPPPQSRRFRRASLAAAATVFAFMWLPPLVEEITHSPGNISTLARFFTSSHAEFDRGIDHSPRTSAGQVARQLTVLPGGWSAQKRPARPLDVAAAAGGLLTAAGVVVAGWRRRDSVLVTLGALPVSATVAAIWSTTRIVGDVLPYLLLWTSVLLLPAWIGAGAVVANRRIGSSGRRLGSRALAAGLIAVGVCNGWSMLRAASPPLRSSSDVTAAGGLARQWLTAHDVRNVRIQFADHGEWPLAAGMINHLERKGVDVTVDRQYAFLFGDQFEPSGRERATVRLTPSNNPPPNGQFERLGDAGAAVVWAGLVSPS